MSGGGGTYVYDGDGNRVEKTVSSTTTLYWPGAGSLLDESNSSGSTTGMQVWFDGLLVWREDTSGNGIFLFQDQLGSTRVTGTASGTLDDDIDYESFGDVYHNYGSSPSSNPFLFTGYESDAETTSDHATFRSLGMTLGRFNRPDPYDGSYNPTNPQSLNRYSYTLNNPLAFIDPSGLDICYEDDGGDVSAACNEGGFAGGADGGDAWGGDPYGFGPEITVDGLDESSDLVGAEFSSGAIQGYGGGPPGTPNWVSDWQQVAVVSTGEQPDYPGDMTSDVNFVWEDFGGLVYQPSVPDSVGGSISGLLGHGGGGGGNFGWRTSTFLCHNANENGKPTMAHCDYTCEGGSGGAGSQPAVSNQAISMTTLQRACGPVSSCPRMIITETRLFYLGPIGLSFGRDTVKVTHCSP